ncbi:hypothetical protein HPB50_009585 [Hyalomma asiaticum]|uniref:Uncharacterized protein n=1 Tax=Hyalomma asiaticum TaxID=266040 RepID=A0ACB7RQI3_HYAAI|nr:hypothetical protein HPB50_009585 [Hyalomma asiaticum]
MKMSLEEPRLVYPRLLEGRSSDGKLVLHVHGDLTLNLEQASVAAPELRVLDEKDGASVVKMPITDEHQEKVLRNYNGSMLPLCLSSMSSVGARWRSRSNE